MARLCSVSGCGEPHSCKGYCRKHYQRVKKYGHHHGGPTTHAPPEVKFWRYVEKRGPDECWPWTGSRYGNGYGKLGVDATKKVLAHRLSYLIATGEEPEVVMHTCDNPGCVNPAHLRAGTRAENTADMHFKGRDRWNRARGAEHHSTTLTEETVRQIKSRPNEKPGKLAAEYGVQYQVIYRIRTGRAWTHID